MKNTTDTTLPKSAPATPSFTNRETWLLQATEDLRDWFEHRHGTAYKKVRVSCGWPSKAALSSKARRIGECWSPEASSDATCEIFISPFLSDVASPQGVLATLVHELVHACVGNAAGHGKTFRKCATKVGLEGKMTATEAGPELLAHLETLAKDLGEYPHARLDKLVNPTKKQGTRMIKCECGTCGFTCRTTRKWLDEVGTPHCPAHGAMTADKPADSEEDDGGENDGED